MILWFVKRNWKTFYVKSNFDGYAGQYVSLGRPYSHCSVNASSSRHVTRTKKVVRCVTGAWQPCVTNELVKVTWITKDSFLSPWHLFFFKHFIVQFFVAGVTVALDLWRFSTTYICGWSQIFERRRSTTYFTFVDESNVVSRPFPVSERYNFFYPSLILGDTLSN